MIAVAKRYPRVGAMLEAARIAQCLRDGADQLDALAGNANAFETAAVRRLIREIVCETVESAVSLESFDQ